MADDRIAFSVWETVGIGAYNPAGLTRLTVKKDEPTLPLEPEPQAEGFDEWLFTPPQEPRDA